MYKNLIELFKENEGKGAVGAFNLQLNILVLNH